MGVVTDIQATTSANFTCEKLITLGNLEIYRKNCFVVLDRTGPSFSLENGTCREACPKANAKTPNYREFYELNHTVLIDGISQKSVDLSGQVSGLKT